MKMVWWIVFESNEVRPEGPTGYSRLQSPVLLTIPHEKVKPSGT